VAGFVCCVVDSGGSSPGVWCGGSRTACQEVVAGLAAAGGLVCRQDTIAWGLGSCGEVDAASTSQSTPVLVQPGSPACEMAGRGVDRLSDSGSSSSKRDLQGIRSPSNSRVLCSSVA
jgi:hypothetical protein